MPFVDVQGVWVPAPIWWGTSPATGGATLDAAGEKIAWVIQAPRTGAIRRVHLIFNSVATPTDTDLRIESIDLTDGNPSDSLLAANTNTTIPSGSIVNGWVTSPALTADAAVTQGDLIGVVVAPTGTPNYGVTYGFQTMAIRFPHVTRFLSGTWTKVSSVSPNLALEYADGNLYHLPGTYPFTNTSTNSVSTSTTPDEVALKFRLPVPVRVRGAWLWGDTTDGDWSLVLYDFNGSSVLTSQTMPVGAAVGTAEGSPFIVVFPTSVELLRDHDYYLAFKPTTTTADTIYSLSVSSVGIMDQIDGGRAFRWAERTDAGAWTETTTKRPFMGLVLDGMWVPTPAPLFRAGFAG